MMKQKKKESYEKPSTMIGKETILETSVLKSSSSVQVNGQLFGKVEVRASLVVGETGFVKGDIDADFLLVAGKIEGNLNISGQLHLLKTAVVIGDIASASIVIDDGANIEGKCSMVKKSTPVSTQPAKQQKK